MKHPGLGVERYSCGNSAIVSCATLGITLEVSGVQHHTLSSCKLETVDTTLVPYSLRLHSLLAGFTKASLFVFKPFLHIPERNLLNHARISSCLSSVQRHS